MTKEEMEELGDFCRNVGSGKTVETTARDIEIEYERAVEIVKKNAPTEAIVSYEMRRMAEHALQVSMKKLTELAQGEPRISYSITQRGETKSETRTVHNTDLEAAKALAVLAMDMSRIAIQYMNSKEAAKTVEADQKKLFGPWRLKGKNY